MKGAPSQPAERPSGIVYTNPVFPTYFADPFVLLHEGVYYAFGTGALPPGPEAFLVLKSPDLIHWSTVGSALRKPSGMEEGDCWAPEVCFREGRFWLYYSIGQGDKGHHIRAAVSDHPQGPYEDQGRITPESCPFAIDAHPYLHTDGEWWLYYAMDLLDSERPGTSLFVDRLVAPCQLAGSPQLVARATSDWQRFEANREIYGSRYDWHTLEGPFAVRNEGRIYVLYSGGCWQNDTYGVDFVFADRPEGPYQAPLSQAPRTMRTRPGEVIGPGHNSVVRGPDGKTDYIVYHAWNPERTARLMRIDPILWTPEGPQVDGPSCSPRPFI